MVPPHHCSPRTALRVARDAAAPLELRVAAAAALRRGRSSGQMPSTEELLTTLLQVREPAVARQLEAALASVVPSAEEEWASCALLLQRALGGSQAASSSCACTEPQCEVFASGALAARALLRLLTAAVDVEVDALDAARCLCDACLPCILQVLLEADASLAASQDVILDVCGTACKLFFRTMDGLIDYDPSFASGNLPPESLVQERRWPALLGAVLAAPDSSAAAARAKKWTLRLMCSLVEVRRWYADGCIDDEAWGELHAPTQALLTAPLLRAALLCARSRGNRCSPLLRSLALLLLRLFVDDEELVAAFDSPRDVFDVLCPAFALGPDEDADWTDGDWPAVARAEALRRATALFSGRSPAAACSEPLLTLRAVAARWPHEAAELLRGCLVVVGATASLPQEQAELLKALAGWCGTWAGGPAAPTEAVVWHLAAQLVSQISAAAPAAKLTELSSPVWQVALEGLLRMTKSPDAFLRHTALSCLAILARDGRTGGSSTALVHAAIAGLNDGCLAVRTAAVVAAAYSLQPAGQEVATATVLEAALAVGEELADDSVLSELLEKLAHMPGPGAQYAWMTALGRLLEAFLAGVPAFDGLVATADDFDAADVAAAAAAAAATAPPRALAAAAALARRLGPSRLQEARCGLLPRLRQALAAACTTPALLLRHCDEVLDGLSVCCQAPAEAGSPLGRWLPPETLLVCLFHVLCGGISSLWPLDGDCASNFGMLPANPGRFAEVFGQLLHASPAARGCDVLAAPNMALCAVHRLLGEAYGPQLSEIAIFLQLPEVPTGARTASGCKAALLIAKALLSAPALADAAVSQHCRKQLLSAVLQVEASCGLCSPEVLLPLLQLALEVKPWSCSMADTDATLAGLMRLCCRSEGPATLAAALELLAVVLPGASAAGAEACDAAVAKLMRCSAAVLASSCDGPATSRRKRKRGEAATEDEEPPCNGALVDLRAAVCQLNATMASPALAQHRMRLLGALNEQEVSAFSGMAGNN